MQARDQARQGVPVHPDAGEPVLQLVLVGVPAHPIHAGPVARLLCKDDLVLRLLSLAVVAAVAVASRWFARRRALAQKLLC